MPYGNSSQACRASPNLTGLEVPVSLYLSPHADDAVLSCGGRIYEEVRQGRRVLVANFFAQSPPPRSISAFAQGQHAKWALTGDPMAERRAEDRAALAILGAEPLYLDYLDCIYRLHPRSGEALYASEESLFGAIDPAEADLHRELASRTRQIAGPPRPDLTLFAPLAVGHHVDHQLLQRAALELLTESYQVIFYEDYPYVQREGKLEAALAAWPGPSPLQPCLYPLSPEAVEMRIAAIARYASQISTLFGDAERMAEQVRAYCASLTSGQGYAERYWLPSGAGL